MFERSRAAQAAPVNRASASPGTEASPMLRLVAHELRAHVTVLAGYSELLDDEAVRQDPERCRVALAAMRGHLDSLREMAAHLSHPVGSPPADRLAFQPAPPDLHPAALEAAAIT